jgi:tetratricopeptide (TPR) repeat protein
MNGLEKLGFKAVIFLELIAWRQRILKGNMIELSPCFQTWKTSGGYETMKIKPSIILLMILLTLFALNASAVNWDSPGSQTVDQMLGDDGLGPVNTPNIPPGNLQHSNVTQMEQPTNNILNSTQENETQWFKVGVARFEQGRYDESLQAYDKVVQINQQNAVAWNNRGIVLGLLGKSDAALQSFLRATSINSSFAEAWFNVGIAYDIFGEYDNAIEAYTKATEINPNYEQAQMNRNEDINFVRDHQMNPYP